MNILKHALTACITICLASAAGAQTQRHPKYDYPTAARADFVIGCLIEHEMKHEFLDMCACKIDVIADEMSYDAFDEANTVLGVQRNGGMGYAGVLFRDTPQAHQIMGVFHKAQDQANKICK